MSYKEIITHIDSLQQTINAHGALTEEVKKKINYKIRLDWNYYSNRMEGGTLTREETRSVMVGNIDVKGKPLKDVLEMNGHDKVVLEVLKIGKSELRISEKRIKEIHKAIMHEEDKAKLPLIGNWKTHHNEIINYKDEKISFTPPNEVPEAMHTLLDKTNAELDAFFAHKESSHPLVIASQFHIGYVTIHPFYDGNGRTARILTNLLLISCGLPPIIIKDRHKQAYYQLLADIQAYGGNAELFYAFIGERILETQQLVLDAIEGKEIEDEDDFLKEIRLLKNKTENAGLSKSPRLVYETYEAVNKEIWLKLSETLKHFDELFTDSNTSRLVNHLDEEFPKKDRSDLFNPFVVSTAPKKPKIFGHDIYEMDIRNIEWYHEKFGLRGSRDASKFEINFNVSFDAQSYTIKLSANYQTLYEAVKKYGDLLLLEEATKIDKTLKDYVLSEIKKRIKADE